MGQMPAADVALDEASVSKKSRLYRPQFPEHWIAARRVNPAA
jgi:hypothetical protein